MGSFRKKISTTFKNRYRIILRKDENLEEKVSVVLTPLNVLVFLCGGLFLFGALIYILLAYTPLNILFPTKSAKYSSIEQYEMIQKIDSLEISLSQLNLQSEVLGKVLAGEDVDIDYDTASKGLVVDEAAVVSEDLPIQNVNNNKVALRPARDNKRLYNFFIPLKGVFTDTFSIENKHRAVDIVAESKTVVKSVQKGTVIFSGWTASGGHTLVIQHPNEFISVYKHNAVVLKKEGTFVNSGDAVALVGNSGELTSGPHLHFELWQKGLAVNPRDYINF